MWTLHWFSVDQYLGHVVKNIHDRNISDKFLCCGKYTNQTLEVPTLGSNLILIGDLLFFLHVLISHAICYNIKTIWSLTYFRYSWYSEFDSDC